jgi:hypothetical protein
VKIFEVFKPRFLAKIWGFNSYNSYWVKSTRDGWSPQEEELKILLERADSIIRKEMEECKERK